MVDRGEGLRADYEGREGAKMRQVTTWVRDVTRKTRADEPGNSMLKDTRKERHKAAQEQVLR